VKLSRMISSAVPRIKERSAAIDVLRVLAIVAVAASHLWGESATLRTLTFSWHVPMFFFLSGYLWTSGRSIAYEMRVRFKSLIVPFIAWSVVLGLAIIVVLTVLEGSPLDGLFPTLMGGAQARGLFAPYWFLPVLFFSAVLYRVLEKFGGVIAALIVGLVGLVAFYLWGGWLAFWVPQGLAITLPVLLFLVAGQTVRKYEARVPHRGIIGVALLAASLALLLTGVALPLDMKLGNFGTPALSMLVAVFICTGLLWVLRALLPGQLPAPVGSIVTQVAQTLVVILLTHTFVYFVLTHFHLPYAAVFVVTLVATAALGLFLNRTRLSPIFVGLPRRRSATTDQRNAADVESRSRG
jgi:acyltransferase